MRYFLEIAFKGTNYNGWQIQKNGISVQQKMDEALCTILRDEIQCVGCGRTDAGVHASQFYLHFDTKKEFPEDFIYRMNAFLPYDIAVKKLIPVAENAHVRFDAKMRTYNYKICNEKNPFKKEVAFYKPFYRLNFNMMQDACAVLKKYNDFPGFCKSQQGSKTTIVNIKDAYWKNGNEGEWTFIILADRFLRGMVRLIVGALMQIGEHKLSLDEFEEGIKSGRRFKSAFSAPAEGLFLTAVKYDYIET